MDKYCINGIHYTKKVLSWSVQLVHFNIDMRTFSRLLDRENPFPQSLYIKGFLQCGCSDENKTTRIIETFP